MDTIRFVSHPLFDSRNALEEIEKLKPAGDPRGSDSSDNATSPIGKLCQQPTLSRGWERYLFLRMNYAKFRANEESGTRRKSWLAEAAAFRDRILSANLRLLVSTAGQFAAPQLQTEDLVSEGVLPLIRAIELFDVSRGWAFGTYATNVLRNHFHRIGQRRQKRNRLASHGEPWLQDLHDTSVPAERQIELAGRHQRMVKRFLAELSETDQEILRARFGFDDPSTPRLRSYAEIGRAVGLSKERVRVRAHRALEQLRETAIDRGWDYPELELSA